MSDEHPAHLHLAEDLDLPLAAVTSAFGVLGQRGSGKTSTAVVLVEEMLRAGVQTAVIDPLDAWWGLRASRDGDGPGLPIVVCGGEHGDLPLTVAMAAALADVAVDERVSLICSLRHLSKSDQRRFVAAWAERLYQRKGAAQHRQPLHVVVDEADAFVPQAVRGDVARTMGAIDDLVRRGRSSGFGITLITQRAAAINKDVLSQIDTLIALRTVSPQDRKALESWIEAHDSDNRRGEFLASLATLAVGEAWVWSPGWLDLFERVRIRPRDTFDSSATPKVGEIVAAPAALATVDLDALRERLDTLAAPAATDDPKALRARIVTLERQLAAAPVSAPAVVTAPAPDVAAAVLAARKILTQLTGAIANATTDFQAGMVASLGDLEEFLDGAAAAPGQSGPPRAGAKAPTTNEGRRHALRKGERHMLTVLTRHPAGLTRQQLATLSGFTVSGGTFGTYLGTLKRGGYLVERDGLLSIAALPDDLPAEAPPASTAEVVAMWKASLRQGERAMLDVLVAEYPAGLSREELGERAGYTTSGGTFGTYLGRLRRNGLVEDRDGQVIASPTLFLETAQ